MKELDTQMMRRPDLPDAFATKLEQLIVPLFDTNVHLPYVKLFYILVCSDEAISQSVGVSGHAVDPHIVSIS
jgi:hypothetical protein